MRRILGMAAFTAAIVTASAANAQIEEKKFNVIGTWNFINNWKKIEQPYWTETIGKNTGASTITFATVTLPNDVLFFHPGQATAQDAILRFTAATAGIYTLSGNFIRLDSTFSPNGGIDGILASILVDRRLFRQGLIDRTVLRLRVGLSLGLGILTLLLATR